MNADMINSMRRIYELEVEGAADSEKKEIAELNSVIFNARLRGSLYVSLYAPRFVKHWGEISKLYNPKEPTLDASSEPKLSENSVERKLDIVREHVKIYFDMDSILAANLDRITESGFTLVRYRIVSSRRDKTNLQPTGDA